MKWKCLIWNCFQHFLAGVVFHYICSHIEYQKPFCTMKKFHITKHNGHCYFQLFSLRWMSNPNPITIGFGCLNQLPAAWWHWSILCFSLCWVVHDALVSCKDKNIVQVRLWITMIVSARDNSPALLIHLTLHPFPFFSWFGWLHHFSCTAFSDTQRHVRLHEVVPLRNFRRRLVYFSHSLPLCMGNSHPPPPPWDPVETGNFWPVLAACPLPQARLRQQHFRERLSTGGESEKEINSKGRRKPRLAWLILGRHAADTV